MLFGRWQILIIVFCVGTNSLLAKEPNLPRAIKKDLTRHAGKWQLVTLSQADRKKGKAVMTGDFDGNGRTDFAVYVLAGKGPPETRQRLIIYLQEGTHYRRRTLSRQLPNSENVPYRFKKGQRDYRYDTDKYFRYRYDTIGLFSEKGGVSYLYRKGRFYPVITSD